MGSKSRSSTSSINTTKDTTVNNVDNRVAEGESKIGGNINLNLNDITTDGGALGGSGGVNVGITTSDFGALDTASEISDRAFEFAGSTADRLTESVGASLSTARDAVSKAVGVASEATRDEAARTQQLLIVGAVVLGVAFVYITTKGRK